MSNERVDVLAVMGSAIRDLECVDARNRDTHLARLAEARAAVAGLLDAIDRVFHEWDNIGPALDKLRSARSNIGGTDDRTP